MTWLSFLASAQTSITGSSVSVFLQYGAIGVIALVGVWFAHKAYRREADRADANEAEVRRLNQAIQDRFVPAITESSVALRDTQELVRELAGNLSRPPPRRRSP